MIFNILSRLETRTDIVRQFAASSNLLLLQRYIKKDIYRELFVSGGRRYIKYCWIIKETPFFLVMTCDFVISSLHLINTKTKQHLGRIDLRKERLHKDQIEIVINDNFESLQHLNNIFQLNGKVYIFKDKTFYSVNFQNEISIIHLFDEKIYHFFILNTNIFAFIFYQSIVLFNINNTANIQQKIVFPTKDLFLGSTKSTRFVHSVSCLPIRTFKIIT